MDRYKEWSSTLMKTDVMKMEEQVINNFMITKGFEFDSLTAGVIARMAFDAAFMVLDKYYEWESENPKSD